MSVEQASIPLRRRAFYAWMHVRNFYDGLLFDLKLWNREASPHVVKRRTVREYARRFGVETLVESGTYNGDMVAAMARDFRRIYSIELSPLFHEKARLRLARHPHVTLLQGDSGAVLPQVLAALDGRALFWLDAHYSGGLTCRGAQDTPIGEELRHILGDPRDHVVLVDDAREFNGTNGYPTIEQLVVLVGELRPDYEVSVANDIIRIHRRAA
jgi:hypothetical protein